MSDDSSKAQTQHTDISYYRVPWGPAAGILMTAATYFGAAFLASILLYLFVGLLSRDGDTDWVEDSLAIQFAFTLIVQTITVGAIALFLDRIKASWQHLGFRRPRLIDLGFAGMGFGVYFAAVLIVTALAGALLPIDTEQEQALGFNPDTIQGFGALAATFVSLVLLPPLVEETLFRGFLFGGMRRKLRYVPAAIITSAIFALPHMLQGADGRLLWIGGIDTFVLSLVLCHLREKTGSLWASIGVHMLKNGLAFLSLFILRI